MINKSLFKYRCLWGLQLRNMGNNIGIITDTNDIMQFIDYKRRLKHGINKTKISTPDDHIWMRNKVFRCNTSKRVIHILTNRSNEINHSAVLSIGIKKCVYLKDYSGLDKLMDIIVNQYSHLVDVVNFNVYFDQIRKFQSNYHICVKYYNIMTTKLNIKPDKFTYSILIKLCLHQPLLYQEFTMNLVDNLIEYDNHMLDISLYVVLFKWCSKFELYHKADTIFNEYFLKSEYVDEITIYNSYLNVYARKGDTYKMNNIINIMNDHDVKFNFTTYGTIMKYYINSKKYSKCLELYDDLNVNDSSLNLMKLIALQKLQIQYKILNDKDESTKYFNEAMNCFNVTYSFKKVKLLSNIVEYCDINPNNIIEYFEKNEYKYLKRSNHNILCIDLHLYNKLESQFILRYIFAFKLNLFDSNHDLNIFTGYGKHQTKAYSLKNDVKNEINSWNNITICVNSNDNPGLLLISKDIWVKFLNNSPTMIYFDKPNINDWCLNDEL